MAKKALRCPTCNEPITDPRVLEQIEDSGFPHCCWCDRDGCGKCLPGGNGSGCPQCEPAGEGSHEH